MAELTTLGGPIAAALEALPSGRRLSYGALDDVPAPPVASVNGRTGNVVIGPADVGSPSAAVVGDLRAVSGTGYKTPAAEGSLDTLAVLSNASGNVVLNPADPVTGWRNILITVAGAVTFSAPVGLPYMTGTIRVRMLGIFTVNWNHTIRRSVTDAQMQPDVRPWKDTLYGFEVVDGLMRVFLHDSFDSITNVPTFSTYGAAYDLGAGVATTTTLGGTIAGVGDPVRYLPPVGQNLTYINSGGGNNNDTVAGITLSTAETEVNAPVMVSVGGKLGIRGNLLGTGIGGTIAGAQALGLPNPAASPNNAPYYTRMTIMASVFFPVGMTAGCLLGAFRGDTSNTSQMALMAEANAVINGYGRFSQGSVPQIGSASQVASNSAVHANSLDGAFGRWMLVAKQVRVNGATVDTVEDSAPPSTTTRGTGATWETWLDNFQGEGSDHDTVNFSSYRGTGGFRPNRLRLFARGSGGGTPTLPNDGIISRLAWSMSPTLTYGNAEWNTLAGWVNGVKGQ